MNLTKNTIFKQCLRLAAFALLAGATTGCERDSDLDLPLAVNSNKLELETIGGSTHIMIYSQGDWNVRFAQPIDWGALNVLAGTGNADVVFSYSENLEAPRRVDLVISNDHGVDTVKLIQKGFTTELAFKKNEISIPNNKTRIGIPFSTNLKEQFKQVRYRITDPDAPMPEGQKAAAQNDDINTQPDWYLGDLMLNGESITFNVAANDTGKSRRLKVEMLFIDGTDKLSTASVIVTQTTDEPSFAFQNEEQEISRAAGEVSLKLETNLTYSTFLCTAKAAYPTDGSENWVTGFRFEQDVLYCTVTENTTGADRSATITALYPISQDVFERTEMTLVQTSNDLRMLIPGPTGSVTVEEEITFEGIVVSDAGNANLEVNPNKTLTSIDFTENDKTAYVQRMNGAYGFRLKFTAAAENTLKRYSHVKISTKGLTLTKEQNPTRYTLSGLTAAHVTATAGQASDLRVKNRKIADLTDDDLYTFVTLDEVQFAIPAGSYTNVNDGYQTPYEVNGVKLNPNGTTAPRLDCTPKTLFDSNGDNIRMLVNGKTPWRRTGKAVPAGIGSLSGIVVYSNLLRFGPGEGSLGRYEIRVLEEQDIALDNSAGGAQTLVEWNWQNKTLGKNSDGTLAPAIGTGSLYSTIQKGETTPYQLTGSYNNPINSDSNKGLLANTAANFCCSATNSWWNFTTDKGEAIVASFSTSGISASRMVAVFDLIGGNGSNTSNKFPANWRVEYSTDGTNFTPVANSDVCIRPLVWWTNTGAYCTPGANDYAVKLPADALNNRNQVWIAIRATGKSYCKGDNNNAEGAENGTLAAGISQTGHIRISTFSIKYN